MGFPGWLGAEAGDIVPPGHPPHKQPGISLPGSPPPSHGGSVQTHGPRSLVTLSGSHSQAHTPLIQVRWRQFPRIRPSLPSQNASQQNGRAAVWLGWESVRTPRGRAGGHGHTRSHRRRHETRVHRRQQRPLALPQRQELPEHQAWAPTTLPGQGRQARQQHPSTWGGGGTEGDSGLRARSGPAAGTRGRTQLL